MWGKGRIFGKNEIRVKSKLRPQLARRASRPALEFWLQPALFDRRRVPCHFQADLGCQVSIAASPRRADRFHPPAIDSQVAVAGARGRSEMNFSRVRVNQEFHVVDEPK